MSTTLSLQGVRGGVGVTTMSAATATSSIDRATAASGSTSRCR